VSSNPNAAKRPALLQTPAHAAGEVGRVLEQIAADEMPLAEWGAARRLDPALKRALLDTGTAFAEALDRGRAWEADNRRP